ncbi:MAG: histidine kinase [Anaerolineae bacterium]|nr:histidine kinase [Anaerolineae bacterium]
MRETESRGKRLAVRVLSEFCLPALAFALGVGIATGDWPASMVTGVAVSGAIAGLRALDRWLIHPQLVQLSPDWLHLGLEMTLLLIDHALGALGGLLVCSRLFGFRLAASMAWVPVAGMVVAFPIVHGTEMALRFFRQLREKERQEAQLLALASEAELRALKAQIDPHFFFNTLNTIASLIHTNPDQAEMTVERLAEMFRYVLAGNQRRTVPLEEEVAFVNGYLEIERARFGDRLRVSAAIAPQALSVPVPSLILQPLVENAVRHGQGADGSIDLAIRVSSSGGEVTIAIADQGPGMPSGPGAEAHWGIGLRNVDERLRRTYGEAHKLAIEANEPRGTVVTVRVPARDR